MLVYPVPVQGAGAAREIAAMLALADRRREVDVILLVRGGGSLEDLWAFNDEALARVIAGVSLPLVTGIGHEVDFTIADFVADLRAPTPSAAAELAVPDSAGWLDALEAAGRRLAAAAARGFRQRTDALDHARHRLGRLHPAQRLGQHAQRLDELQARALVAMQREFRARREQLLRARAELAACSPATRVESLAQRIAHAGGRLAPAMRHRLALADGTLRSAARALEATSPLATLARGYAIVTIAGSGAVVRDATEAPAGTEVDARLAHGRLRARVIPAKP